MRLLTFSTLFYLNINVNIVIAAMGAGICPISKFRNNVYVLLGQERFNKQWSDFGGSRNGNETPYQTACREGYEELDGFLGSEQDVKNLVNTRFIHKLDNNNNYHSFLFQIDYDKKLPFYFNNHHKFIEKQTKNICGRNGLYEKKEIKWFTISELKNLENVRPHFKVIIENIILLCDDLNCILD